jgi:hypothetical protein
MPVTINSRKRPRATDALLMAGSSSSGDSLRLDENRAIVNEEAATALRNKLAALVPALVESGGGIGITDNASVEVQGTGSGPAHEESGDMEVDR